jgi:hypothetical protein
MSVAQRGFHICMPGAPEVAGMQIWRSEMPLHGTELFANPVLAKLWEVKCLLAAEDQWCKARLHDRKGRHCLVGAITEADARQELSRAIIRAIKDVSGKRYWRIESFNDDPSTNHRDVLRVLNHARLLIIADIAHSHEARPWLAKMCGFPHEVMSLATGYSGLGYSDMADVQPHLLAVPVRINDPVHPEAPRERRRETADISG